MPFVKDPVTGMPGYKLPEFDEDEALTSKPIPYIEPTKTQVDLTAPMDPPPPPPPDMEDSDFDEPYGVTGPQPTDPSMDATAHAEGDFLRMPPPLPLSVEGKGGPGSYADAAKQQFVNRANVGVFSQAGEEERRQRDRADFRREMALRMAQEADPHGSLEQVVTRAHAYLMFLEGEDRYRQADEQEQPEQ